MSFESLLMCKPHNDTHLKPEPGFGPSSQVTFSKSSKIIDLGIRNTCLNVCKTFLNSFRDRRHVFCCKNTVYKHYFTGETIGKTSKFLDFDRFCSKMSMLWCLYQHIFFVIIKIQKLTSEMKRSRSVDSSRYQTFCLTPSEQKVINKIKNHIFYPKKMIFRTEPGFGL